MTHINSPQLFKGGLIVLDADGALLRTTIALQYNPDTLTRRYEVQSSGSGEERRQPFRLKGPAVETLKFDAEIDATDALEHPAQNAHAVAYGIAPQLAVLESLVNPSTKQLLALNALSQAGTLEILPPEAPLVLFIWSKNRVVPVRVTEFTITEEAFDVALNPIRAKVSLGLRVLSTDDLGFEHRGGAIFINYLRTREALAGKTGAASLKALGLSRLPG